MPYFKKYLGKTLKNLHWLRINGFGTNSGTAHRSAVIATALPLEKNPLKQYKC